MGQASIKIEDHELSAQINDLILPPRTYETDEENRLAETLNHMGDRMLRAATAEAGVPFRRFKDAPSEARRHRSIMKKALEDAAAAAMAMLAHSLRSNPEKENDYGK